MPVAHSLLDAMEEVAVLRVLSTIQLVYGEHVESYARRFAEVCHVHFASLHFLTTLWLPGFFHRTPSSLSNVLLYRFLQLSPIASKENITKQAEILPYHN